MSKKIKFKMESGQCGDACFLEEACETRLLRDIVKWILFDVEIREFGDSYRDFAWYECFYMDVIGKDGESYYFYFDTSFSHEIQMDRIELTLNCKQELLKKYEWRIKRAKLMLDCIIALRTETNILSLIEGKEV
jgi:hypothetical protein